MTRAEAYGKAEQAILSIKIDLYNYQESGELAAALAYLLKAKEWAGQQRLSMENE